MNEKSLTLAECLNQPRGYEGRLFQPPRSIIDISTYRIIDRREKEMDIEVYVLGGRTEIKKNVPLEPRLQDLALHSRELLSNYVGIGRALKSPSGCSAIS